MVGIKKGTQLFIFTIISLFVLIGCTNTDDKDLKTIGISQIVEHPALDRSRQGFIDALASRGFIEGETIRFDIQSAQGDVATAQLIAQNFVSKKVDMIAAIATPSAQAAKNATSDIPIVFTAVTDPVSAGLVDSLESPGRNITGTSDMSPIDKQFDLMETLLPTRKRIGIIYNTSETNSEIQVNIAQEIASERGFSVTLTGISSTNELQLALDSILDDIDILLVPTDNLVASSMPLIISKTLEKNIPVFGTEKAHVEAGALITDGIDYYNLGFQTGLIAADILEDKREAKDIKVETLQETQLSINTQVASQLGITIPDQLKNRAELIDSIGSGD